ncbi:MAG TPA: Ig-like domain-containing protein [Steroidobacteraceae bacterium]|nr:Ig-like domain-containing protein [Steroidobacteraceae bacterium]
MSFPKNKHGLVTRIAAAVMLAWLGGCAGNGAGLNANGVPAGSGSSGSGSGGSGSGGSGPGTLTADFESIQANVFTPICSPCHSGATAPEGLMLDANHSYNLLVGVPSTEVPSLDRIKPGDPDNSYLVLKIQGSAGIVGSQMPLHETPLPQATIDVIRQWVTNGAPPATSSGAMGATSGAVGATGMDGTTVLGATTMTTPVAHVQSHNFSVVDTSPVDGAVVSEPVRTIVVAFNHELDASLVNYTTLVVERLDAEVVHVPAYAALANGNPDVALITPAAPLVPGVYRVTVRGTGGGALADLGAQVLGADYSFTFTVDVNP